MPATPFTADRWSFRFAPIALAPALAAALAVSGCSTLPASAPTTTQILHSSKDVPDSGPPMLLVDLDRASMAGLLPEAPPSLATTFSEKVEAGDLRIGPGDVLAFSIWETGPAGLFTQTTTPPTQGGRNVTLQLVTVGHDGDVTLPYVGRVRAAGLTPDQLAEQLKAALAPMINSPGVMVYLNTSVANAVTVGGDVNRAGVMPMTLRGDRLLDMIAAAGGSKWPVYETYVRMIRGGRAASLPLQAIIAAPENDLLVRPGDSIFVYRQPETFSAFGAAGKVGQYTFDQPSLSFIEALSKAGGLADLEASPGGVFLFRRVSRAEALRLSPTLPASTSPDVNLLLRVRLDRAAGFFRAQQLEMRNRDVILATNASVAQGAKLAAFLRNFTQAYSELTLRPASP
jgi:polysaccharide biosynthesis/export protein